MKKAPNSKTNLDKAILRFAGEVRRANLLRSLMANAIVAQMIRDGVVKGGSGLRFRYGEKNTRATMDLDTAWRIDLDSFIRGLREKLAEGWCGFSGEVRILRPSNPKGVPFGYVMQPCEVKLTYLAKPWFTVQLEVGHNELGDADESEMIDAPSVLIELVEYLGFPRMSQIPMMQLEYQVAQKLHGATAPGSRRAHDLIDLQLILANGDIDFHLTHSLCCKLFKYRRVHTWPPKVAKGEGWEQIYDAQRLGLDVLETVNEAVEWTNQLIDRINNS